MKTIAFGASYSSTSINRKFAGYVGRLISPNSIEVLDLNDFELPLFTVDIEKAIGHPEPIHRFIAKLQEADLLVISMGEHNGSYQAAFKNLMDWSSRVKPDFFSGKPILLLSTSPGGRGGLSAMNAALDRFPRHGGEIIDHFSLPKFNDNFSETEGVTDPTLKQELAKIIEKIKL